MNCIVVVIADVFPVISFVLIFILYNHVDIWIGLDDVMSLDRNVLNRMNHYQVSILIWTWITLWCRCKIVDDRKWLEDF
jgi:hypothetical protein